MARLKGSKNKKEKKDLSGQIFARTSKKNVKRLDKLIKKIKGSKKDYIIKAVMDAVDRDLIINLNKK